MTQSRNLSQSRFAAPNGCGRQARPVPGGARPRLAARKHPLASDSEAAMRDRILELKEKLAEVTNACALAGDQREPGQLFFLLRKKWQLIQELFEAENADRLRQKNERSGRLPLEQDAEPES